MLARFDKPLYVFSRAVVMVYNVPDVSYLNLSRDNIVGIYNGTYTWWNDTNIQKNNPKNVLPEAPILPVARADKSGTTVMFTSALASFNSNWNKTYGTFSIGVDSNRTPVRWRPAVVKLFGMRNRGMSGLVLSVPYTVGYLSLADAIESQMQYAHILNRAGHYVTPTIESLSDAQEGVINTAEEKLTFNLTDPKGTEAYPIVGFTYFIVRLRSMTDCNVATELVRYSMWITTSDDARLAASRKGFQTLSGIVARLVKNKVLKRMTCKGENVYKKVQQVIRAEEVAAQSWRLPVLIAGPIAVIIFSVLLAFIVYQQYMMNKKIFQNDWFIPEVEISHSRLDGFGSGPLSNSQASISKTQSTSNFSMPLHGRIDTYWKDLPIVLSNLPETMRKSHLKWTTKRLLVWFQESVVQENIVRFYGITETELESRLMTVTEYCPKGSLYDQIHIRNFPLDSNLKFSLAIDIASGIKFLHDKHIVHGRLSTLCCLVDFRWNVKIAEWDREMIIRSELSSTRKSRVTPSEHHTEMTTRAQQSQNDVNEIESGIEHLFRSPEQLRMPHQPPTKHNDVYSFAVMVHEIFTHELPFANTLQNNRIKDVVFSIAVDGLRPNLINDSVPKGVRDILRKCISTEPSNRPSASKILLNLKKVNPNKTSVVDAMMMSLESYATNLEEKVKHRTLELESVTQNMTSLLDKMLPSTVASRLAKGEPCLPEYFDSVTILVSGIVDFTRLSAECTPLQVINLLNSVHGKFDCIVEKYDAYKVETIGRLYSIIYTKVY